MPKKTDNTLLVGLGLAGVAAYLYFRKRPSYAAPVAPADDPSAPVGGDIPANFEEMQLQDAGPYLARTAQQARTGDLAAPVVVVSGMTRDYAVRLASQNLDVQFVWVGDMPAPPDISGPWIQAMGVPNKGPGDRSPFPQQYVPGLADENTEFLDEVIHYAKTSLITGSLLGMFGDAP